MRTLRNGGHYADDQIWRYGKTAILYFLGCVAVVVVFFFVSYELVALFGLIAAFRYFGTVYDRWENWFLGKRGELAVRRELEALPDDYILLNDLLLPNGYGNLDHVLIAPNGLFVIETKNYSSNVKCIGDQWLTNGKPSKSLTCKPRGARWHCERVWSLCSLNTELDFHSSRPWWSSSNIPADSISTNLR